MRAFDALLATAQADASDTATLIDLANRAIDEGEEERAVELVAVAAEQQNDARLWQWAGLLQRSLDQHAEALRSFEAAARLAPDDQSIAHGHARVALEAGIDAITLYEHANDLGQPNSDILIGLAAARFSAGQGERAADELEAILSQVPLWLQGHHQLAQIRSMLGTPSAATRSLESALQAHPQSEPLWAALFELHIRSENFESLESSVERARIAGIGSGYAAKYLAIALSEQGRLDAAEAMYFQLAEDDFRELAIWRIRHLLRCGRLKEAILLIDEELEGNRKNEVWPYAAAAWRAANDSRLDWLECGGRLVQTFDISADLPPLARLEEVLRSLHVAKSEHLDQSVRGGTQTDGPLFCRLEPEIRGARQAIETVVESYAKGLPRGDPGHPTLGAGRGGRVRFSGSWSVLLKSMGRHANHVHPQGWISSALYVTVPPKSSADPSNAGFLSLGEPPECLGMALGHLDCIKPMPGKLVLFPSWMWHGTVPFAEGERLTIAFDVARPRQLI